MKQQIPKKIPAVYFLLARNLSLVGCSPAEPTSVSVLNAKFITTNYIYNLQKFPTTFTPLLNPPYPPFMGLFSVYVYFRFVFN